MEVVGSGRGREGRSSVEIGEERDEFGLEDEVVDEGRSKVDVFWGFASTGVEVESERRVVRFSILWMSHLDRLGSEKKLSCFDVSSRDDPSTSSLQRNDLDGSDEVCDVHPRRGILFGLLGELDEVILPSSSFSKTILRSSESD